MNTYTSTYNDEMKSYNIFHPSIKKKKKPNRKKLQEEYMQDLVTQKQGFVVPFQVPKDASAGL